MCLLCVHLYPISDVTADLSGYLNEHKGDQMRLFRPMKHWKDNVLVSFFIAGLNTLSPKRTLGGKLLLFFFPSYIFPSLWEFRVGT